MSTGPNEHGVIVGSAREGPSIAGFHKIVGLQRCETEYRLHDIVGLSDKHPKDNTAMAVGTICHAGRAAWFATQCTESVDFVVNAIQDYVKSSNDPVKVTAEREAIRLMTAYVKHWRLQPKPNVLDDEYPLGPAPLKENDPFFLYRTARLDDVSIYPDSLGQAVVGDLKTTSDSISGCMNEYRQHGQFITYAILWKMAKEGQAKFGPSPGVMIDIMTKDDNPKFHRELIVVTEFQQRWWYANMSHLLRRAAQITESTPTMRDTTQCARSISRKGSYLCQFHKLCQYGVSAAGQYILPNGDSLDTRPELVDI